MLLSIVGALFLVVAFLLLGSIVWGLAAMALGTTLDALKSWDRYRRERRCAKSEH